MDRFGIHKCLNVFCINPNRESFLESFCIAELNNRVRRDLIGLLVQSPALDPISFFFLTNACHFEKFQLLHPIFFIVLHLLNDF